MKRTYKKFLVISTIFFVFGGFYIYFSGQVKNEKVVPVAYGSSLVSSITDTVTSTTSSINEKLNSDISFLNSLVSLKKITIDTTLFTNKTFNSLKDNSVKLEAVSPGRRNPFAPVGTDSVVNVYSSATKVVTDQPAQITATSADLNGTINTSEGVTDLYFKYGTTKDLNITTSIVKQSLVGMFVKNISGLTPKTAYFFKACAKINNVENCGEIVSFTTN